VRERVLGPDHPDVARSLTNLAGVLRLQGRHAEAEPLHRRALVIAEGVFGPDHPGLRRILRDLAASAREQGRPGEALDLIRRASAIQRARSGLGEAAGDDPSGRDEVGRGVLSLHVAVGASLARDEPARRAALRDETFEAAQLLVATDTAAATARISARFAPGGGELAGAVREQQALARRRRELDRGVVEAAGQPPAERDPARDAALRRELAEADRRLLRLDRELARRFPDYRQLTAPEPAGIGEVQALLGDDEALLAYLLDPAEDASRLWVVRRGRAELLALDAGPRELADAVGRLRAQLDPGPEATGAPVAFDRALAHELYRDLLPPGAAPLLAGARHPSWSRTGRWRACRSRPSSAASPRRARATPRRTGSRGASPPRPCRPSPRCARCAAGPLGHRWRPRPSAESAPRCSTAPPAAAVGRPGSTWARCSPPRA
jgi:hypothetical protein